MASIERVASTADLAPGSMRRVTVQGREVLLVNHAGQFHATAADCTHEGGPLEEGQLKGLEVECPWHGGTFNVATGEVLAAPPEQPLSRYAVIIQGDDLLVDVGTAPA